MLLTLCVVCFRTAATDEDEEDSAESSTDEEYEEALPDPSADDTR